MINPNRGVYENHATLVGRLLGIGDSFFSVPPRSANRLALSFAISASRPILTSAVFSEMPVSLPASFKRPLSILSVVLICINMYRGCNAIKSLGGDNIEFSCPAASDKGFIELPGRIHCSERPLRGQLQRFVTCPTVSFQAILLRGRNANCTNPFVPTHHQAMVDREYNVNSD